MRYLILLLLFATPVFADSPAWESTPDGTIMREPIKEESLSLWDNEVGHVTGVNGVHTHVYGINACKASERDANTITFHPCTVHIDGPVYDINTTVFPGLTSIILDFDSAFVGAVMSGYTQQDTYFTDENLKTVIPLARVQKQAAGTLSIIDQRNIVSAVDNKDYQYRRGAIGAPMSLDGGLIPTETGVRNLNLSEGSFYDEEGERHGIPVFNLLSTIPLWRTTSSFNSWTTTGKEVFQLDNVNYNDITTGGLVPALNPTRFIYQLIACSTEGGVVRGIDTGRKPTCFAFYGPDEYGSLEAARTSNIDIGSFGAAKPGLIIIAKIITNKNNASIVDIWDERRFLTTPSGTSVSIPSTASLQTTYDNSPNGGIAEIITNDINGALDIKHGDVGAEPKILGTRLDDGTNVFDVYTSEIRVAFSNGTSAVFDDWTGTGETRFLIHDIDNGTLERVSVGADDSCGTGYKCLRIIN